VKQVVLGALVAALVSSCGGSPTDTVNPPPPPPSPAGTTIGPSGGTVTSSDGSAVLTFPAGALSSNLAITAVAMTDPPASPGLISALAYDFGPSGSQFAQPVTIKLTYQPSQVPVGISPIFLRLFLRDGSGWDSVPGSTVDTIAHTVTGTTTHFSGFAPCPMNCPGTNLNPQAAVAFPPICCLTLQQGGSVTAIGDVSLAFFTGGVAIALENPPAGVSGSVSLGAPNAPCSSGCNEAATLTLYATSTAPPGRYNIALQLLGGPGGTVDSAALVPIQITALPGYSIAVVPTPMSIAQGNTAGATVTITRTNFTGTVTLAATGLPSGVAASFNPSQLTGTTLSSVLTLTAGASVPAGTTNFSVVGAASGLANQTQTVPLTVAAFSLTATPTALNVAAGGTVTSAIKAVRAGGFNGTITYAVVGVPTGLSATVTPTSVADSEVLSITAAAVPTAGSYPLTVTGTSGGVQQQTSVLVTVSTAGGSFDWSSCATKPLWVAYQDGNGSWTRVAGSGDVYPAPAFASGKGGFAFVLPFFGTGFFTSVVYLTQAEVPAGVTCVPTLTASGSVSGVPAGGEAFITLGHAGTSVGANGAFQIGGVSPGTHDLVAYLQSQFGFGSATGDRVLVSRGVQGGSAGSINFGAGIAPVLDTMTVNGTIGGSLSHTMSYITRGCEAGEIYYLADSTNRIPVFGVPASLQQASDLHALQVTEVGSNYIGRTVTTVFHTLAPGTVTLGSTFAPVVSILTGPYKRLQGVVTLPADYNSVNFSITFGSTGRVEVLGQTRSYSGTGAVTLAMPDFSSVAGFLASWVGATSDVASYVLSANSGISAAANACAEGATASSAYLGGSN
jgi:hypothetical protein